ncbi:hypothetical protein D9611_008459 [Ephemerocybe angulata]|uniref:F-box domain-containing protein n=1 Tax=Ephemerocybe angulata TaxID=980116 RepID=A0A8H5AYS2_9AGAR|nr:hypothetical protein D9611_008459 [Tulosesus angulatus]
MNKCLQAPEILQLICDQVPNETRQDRQRLLAIALSCRALLEPGLDRLWHTIRSFRPLVTTLHPNSLEREIKCDGQPPRRFEVLTLRCEITPPDLDRYLAYYAPRIREVDIAQLRTTFSPETWQNLQLATNWKAGALSPSAWKIVWRLTEYFQPKLSEAILDQTFPYFALFLGPKVTSVHFAFNSETPIHTASLRNATIIPTVLKTLQLEDGSVADSELPFLHDFLTSSSWNNLEGLTIGRMPSYAIPHLSTLPCLSTLEIGSLRGPGPLYSYTEDDVEMPPAHLSSISSSAFRSLKSLKLSSGFLLYFQGFLQHLPPDNQVHTLKCTLEATPGSTDCVYGLLFTISLHCNPQKLRKLVIKGRPNISYQEENLDAQPTDGVDLLSLLRFTGLETLSLNILVGVNLNSDDIKAIIENFPQLVKLKVDTGAFDSRLPRIDHTHVLQLLYKLPHLKKLGLRFDATSIPRDQSEEPALDNLVTNDQPSQVIKLWVGDSPICSPSNTAKFFEAHCPKLRMENVFPRPVELNTPETMPAVMYQRRWKAVANYIVYPQP